MAPKLFEVALSLLLILVEVSCSNQKQHVPIKWPEVESETMVNDYQLMLLALANASFNVTALPKYAHEDGHDIMNELRENLVDCRDRLQSDHLLWQYKVCVHQQLDTFDNRIWDLTTSLANDASREHDGDDGEDDDDKSGSARIFVLLLMPAIVASALSLL